jgi:hypothetical protein
MPDIYLENVDIPVSVEQLLRALRQMKDAELAEFCQQVAKLQAERRAAHLTVAESELFRRINCSLTQSEREEYDGLKDKRDAGTLTEVEHGRLVELSDRSERLHAERLAAVAELARLRRISLREMMQQLGLTSPGYA